MRTYEEKERGTIEGADPAGLAANDLPVLVTFSRSGRLDRARAGRIRE
jgi:hypothetical protein